MSESTTSDLSGTSAVPDDEVREDPQGREVVPTIEAALGMREVEEGEQVTYYAWSPIRYSAEIDENGVVLKNKTIKIGAAVTASRLGISEDEFMAVVASGAIRAYPFPEDMPEGYQGSPIDWLKEKVRNIERQASDLTSGLNVSGMFGSGAKV